MYLVNGSASVEFRIQEKERQVLIRILGLVNGRVLSLARNRDLFQGHPGLYGTVEPSNFTMDAPGLTVSLACLSRRSPHLAAKWERMGNQRRARKLYPGGAPEGTWGWFSASVVLVVLKQRWASESFPADSKSHHEWRATTSKQKNR